MGQLFNRFSRYIKSEINDYDNSSNNNYDNPDDELKRIIDDLNKEKKEKKSDDSEKEKKVSNKNISLDDAYSLLGLSSSASIDEIKSAYKQKVKEYHPDKVANLGEELKKLAEQKTQDINKAYEIIKKYKGFN